jgi:hypothetical protein
VDIAVECLLEAGLTNHQVEQMDGVVLHGRAGDETDQVAADPPGGRSEVGDEHPAPGAEHAEHLADRLRAHRFA